MDQATINRPPIPFGVFFSVLMIVFTLVLGWTAISTSIAPRSYLGCARVEAREKSDGNGSKRASIDGTFTRTEAEIISSELLLRKTIVSLNLNEALGKKYFNGETLKTWETLQILKHRIDVRPLPGTSLIEIRVYDDNPKDPAELANAIANAYVNYVATNSESVEALVVDAAHEVNIPVRPNVAFNMICGVLTGVLLGLVAGTVTAVFVYIKNRNELIRQRL